MTVQAMDDASPTKWHLAHVTWFFETFILAKHLPGYRVFDETFNYCFNSYYESQGARQPRPEHGLLTRPSIDCVMAYRAHVDEGLRALLCRGSMWRSPASWRSASTTSSSTRSFCSPISSHCSPPTAASPAYRARRPHPVEPALGAPGWIEFPGRHPLCGPRRRRLCVGQRGSAPRGAYPSLPARRPAGDQRRMAGVHGRWRLRHAEHRRADGWVTVNREGWQAPLYWEQRDGEWLAMSLEGLHPVERAAPVCTPATTRPTPSPVRAGKRLPSRIRMEDRGAGSGNGQRRGSSWHTAPAARRSGHGRPAPDVRSRRQSRQSAYLP